MSSAYDQGLKLSSQGRHVEAIVQFERALSAMPDDARVLFALANTAQSLGLADVASTFYRRVLAQQPARLEATVNLANLLRATGQIDSAIALLEPALASQPNSAELNITLGSAYREKGNRQRAILYYRAALDARQDYSPALVNLADMLSDEGESQAAHLLYDRAIKCDPTNAQARFNRATFHLLRGQLEQGWRDYAARTKLRGKVPALCGSDNFKLWRGQSLKRVRLLVRCEQGVGDQILFASVIADLATKAQKEGGSILLECEPRLRDLFARSFPNVTVMPARLKTVAGTAYADYTWLKTSGGCSAVTLMGDLPRYLRSAISAFPKAHAFLSPEACETARWKSMFDAEANSNPSQASNKRIGICWRSGKMGGHRANQYAPLDAWAAFLRQTEATFVCVQYDASPEEVARLEQMSERKIIIPQSIDQKNELDRTAAMLSGLDAVVSAPTAVSWLSAGVGTPTFKLLYHKSWTSLGLDYEPFAPCCACIAPKASGDWADVFGQLNARFTKLI